MAVTFPNDTQRITVLGATGSGKTVAGLWQLSNRNFDRKPWIIYDFKRDPMIAQIAGATEISLDDSIPSSPGIYVVHPLPNQENEVSDHMTRIWQATNVGVFVDEALMVGRYNQGFRYLLTQGRSLHIPMIINSQRPSWIDVFVFSESDFFQVFRLQTKKDVDKVMEFVPFDIRKRLPQYHSYYYEVVPNKLVVLRPTPDEDAVLDTFYTRLKRLKKVV